VNLLIKLTEFTFKRIIHLTTVTEINGLSQPTFRKDPEYLKPPDDLKKKEASGNLTYPKLPYYSTRVNCCPHDPAT